jgi:hypothetical protein
MSRFSSLTRRLARASWDVFIVRKRINRLVFFSVWSASRNGLGLAKNYERATARLGPNVASPVIILTRQKRCKTLSCSLSITLSQVELVEYMGV